MQISRKGNSALVEFADADSASRAIEELAGTMLGGRPLNVRADLGFPRERKPPLRVDQVGTRVFVAGVPDHWEWMDLKDFFNTDGTVVHCRINTSRADGLRNGTAIVEFNSGESTLAAIQEFDKVEVEGGHILSVRPDLKQMAFRGPLADDAAGRQLVVFGLPYAAEAEDVLQLLAEDPDVVAKKADIVVEAAEISRDLMGRSRGMARVLCSTQDGANALIELMTGKEYQGRVLGLQIDRYAFPRETRPPPSSSSREGGSHHRS